MLIYSNVQGWCFLHPSAFMWSYLFAPRSPLCCYVAPAINLCQFSKNSYLICTSTRKRFFYCKCSKRNSAYTKMAHSSSDGSQQVCVCFVITENDRQEPPAFQGRENSQVSSMFAEVVLRLQFSCNHALQYFF